MATIQGVYVALFGRPADPTGLAYFNSVTKNGADLNGIGDLASTQEYKDRFAGQNNTQIVNSIYQSLFGRDAEAAGLTFFVNALNNGTLNIKNIAIAILDGAQGSDKTVVTNKVAAADLYTKALDTGPEIVAYSGNAAAAQGRTFLSTVKDTVPTAAAVDTAVAAMVTASNGGGTGGAGVTLTLATGAVADFISPDQANSASKSTAGNDTIRGVAAGDLSSQDSIDGGAGTDTLNAVMALNSAGVKPVLKSIENVNLTYGTGVIADKLTGPISFDLGDSTGVQKITAVNVYSDAAANKVTFDNVDKATTVALKNISVDTNAILAVANFKDVSGGSDSATVSLEKVSVVGVGSLTVQTDGIEKLTVNSTGSAAADTNTVSIKDAVLQTLTLTGDKAITVTSAAGNAALKTVDASALTAALTYTATNNGETITGGSKGDTITLGTGNDTVVFKAGASLLGTGNFDTINGFNAVNADKIDVKAFSFDASSTIGSTTLAPTGDVAGFFSGISATTRFVFNDTDKMLYIDANKDGSFNATTDLAIKLVGVATADLDKTDFILS